MASDDRPSDDLKSKRRGKAPTITLEAQEVVPAAADAPDRAAAAETAPETAPPNIPAPEALASGETPNDDHRAAATPTDSSVAPHEPAKAPAAGNAAPEGLIPEVPGEASRAAAAASHRDEPGETSPTDHPAAVAPPEALAPAGPGFGRLAAAGIVGALLTGGLAVGAQMAGYWPAGAPRQDNAALEQRLAALDGQIRQIAARPTAPASGPAAAPVDLAPFTRRIEALDAARASLETR
ncbi:MAG: hypothetical protein K2X91_04790, partial [Thermoleophilia bacterium]|nr:hypothetical protein [Thermoleophilia bacterium]